MKASKTSSSFSVCVLCCALCQLLKASLAKAPNILFSAVYTIPLPSSLGLATIPLTKSS